MSMGNEQLFLRHCNLDMVSFREWWDALGIGGVNHYWIGIILLSGARYFRNRDIHYCDSCDSLVSWLVYGPKFGGEYQ